MSQSNSKPAIKLLFSCISMIWGKTRMRGGLAYGEAFIDIENSLFVGGPIIEAHELERSQQWSGAALAQSAIERLPNWREPEFMRIGGSHPTMCH